MFIPGRQWVEIEENCERFVASTKSKFSHAVDVTSCLQRGITSLREHRVYIENLPKEFDPEAFLRQNVLKTGKHFGCQYAVSFEVIKI